MGAHEKQQLKPFSLALFSRDTVVGGREMLLFHSLSSLNLPVKDTVSGWHDVALPKFKDATTTTTGV